MFMDKATTITVLRLNFLPFVCVLLYAFLDSVFLGIVIVNFAVVVDLAYGIVVFVFSVDDKFDIIYIESGAAFLNLNICIVKNSFVIKFYVKLKKKMDFDYIKIAELSDLEMAAHMRKCNYEKFKSLVRMHLSFELDLNTDEFDLPCHEIAYEDKGKLKKWNRLSKKHKHNNGIGSSTGCASAAKGSSSASNSPTETLHQNIDSGFMFHLKELKDFLLLEKNVTQEGIFRKTGSTSRQNELRHRIQQDKPLNLEKSGYSAHDCATVFKGYLADLSEPLLTDALYPAHLQIAPLCISTTVRPLSGTSTLTRSEALLAERQKREQHLLSSVQLLLLLLPEDNRELLQHIIDMLHKVSQHEDTNKMNADNLATLFAPHLICPRNLPPEALHYLARKMSNIIAYMIIRGMDIFDIPAKLATDIKAYFLERKRKKTMSPEQMLDESISDVSTVNTVYTFVNREMTAAAHHANTTETELAQLYAHIQSLPESSRKRRLIKQFNKQNGQGTPLQLVAMNRVKGTEGNRSSKSISDSIKKHIFHKGLISRTPKRHVTTSSSMNGNETPNFANTKNPKLRVLFQSPASNNTSGLSSGSENAYTNTITACCNSNSSSSTSTNTPYQLKSHPLQKSISSISLLHQNNTSFKGSTTKRALHNLAFVTDDGDCQSLNSNSSSSCHSHSHSHSNCSHSDNDLVVKSINGRSVSAPVSRQTSEIDHYDFNDQQINDPSCCMTPLKIITDAAKQLKNHNPSQHGPSEKKTVAWHEQNLYEIDEFSNPNTPIQSKTNSSELKSRYKSEPNLSRMLKEKFVASQEVTPVSNKSSSHKSLTRKLIKGVSMGNLKFPFSTPDTTKRLVRSVSTTLKRRTSDETHNTLNMTEHPPTTPLLEKSQEYDLDDETFEDDPNDAKETDNDNDDDEDPSNEDIDCDHEENPLRHTRNHTSSNSNSSELPSCSGGPTSYQHLLLQQSGLYRNINLITSTPSLLLGRRSMSPITKSTQRMPKAMQESIMTPRSRKPVMVLTTTTGSSDQNQTIYQSDFSSFPEQDEHDLSIDGVGNTLLKQSHNSDISDQESKDIPTSNADDEEISLAFTKQRNEISLKSLNSPDIHSEDANLVGTTYINPTRSVKLIPTIQVNSEDFDQSQGSHEKDALTNDFKHYLLTRSVLTASPGDSSFSSRPDDFALGEEDNDDSDNDSFNSCQGVEHLNESKLSPRLLYCLDGNKPDDSDNGSASLHETSGSIKSNNSFINYSDKNQENATTNTILSNNDNRTNRLSSNPFIILNNARKRAATNDLEKHPQVFINSTAMSTASELPNLVVSRKVITKKPKDVRLSPNTSTSSPRKSASPTTRPTLTITKTSTNKENVTTQREVEGYVLSKKLLISEYPGETKF